MLEEDITFIYEYKDQKMVIYGKYKVFGDKLLCELDMDDPLDGYYSMETYLFTYTINEEGIEHSNPYARTWFKDFEYYLKKYAKEYMDYKPNINPYFKTTFSSPRITLVFLSLILRTTVSICGYFSTRSLTNTSRFHTFFFVETRQTISWSVTSA